MMKFVNFTFVSYKTPLSDSICTRLAGYTLNEMENRRKWMPHFMDNSVHSEIEQRQATGS